MRRVIASFSFHMHVNNVSSGEGNGTPLQYSCLENPMDGGAWWAAVHAKGQTRLSYFTFTFQFHASEKEMATHSSVLAWRIPGTGEPGGLPSVGHRVGHDWSDLAAAAAAAHWWSELYGLYFTPFPGSPKDPFQFSVVATFWFTHLLLFWILSPVSALLLRTTVFWYFLSKKLLLLETLSQNLILGEFE